MHMIYLLTGKPGVGKTHLIRHAITTFNGKAGGFYTQEIRTHGERQGFEMITLQGQRATLAHINLPKTHRVGKYGVDIQNLESVGVASLRTAIYECDLIVMDEIGKMEMFSNSFRETALEAIDSGKKVLGTIMLHSHPWANGIKEHPQVNLLQITRSNRDQVLGEVLAWLHNT